MHPKYVYAFEEGDGKNTQLLGGKGANLCEMTQIGLNVPPGFVITATAGLTSVDTPGVPSGVMTEVRSHMHRLEQKVGKAFGSPTNPLLVSVRSGAAMSMPGMMDTIFNLGLNHATLQGLLQQTKNERFGYDAYRRFIHLFGKVALGVPDALFDEQCEAIKRDAGVKADAGLRASHLRDLSARFLHVVQQQTGQPFPEDVYEQLAMAIKAVFSSWTGKRAVAYRREFHITPTMANGTAVNVVAMVFGNMGDDCATGVGFTRNPGTGANEMYGEYLVNAQGEDVVAGIRTPKPVQEMQREMPELYRQLVALRTTLEAHYHEVQEYEYTIEQGTLYCLQTRNGKMNAVAMVRTAVEMVHEGLISKAQALLWVNPSELEQLLHPCLDLRGAHPCGARSPSVPRRCQWAMRVRCGPRRDLGAQRCESDPRAGGDQAGRHSWVLRRAGHLDEPGWQDVPCGRGRAWHGEGLCRRRGGAPHRDEDAPRDGGQGNVARRGCDHHRWQYRARVSRGNTDDSTALLRRPSDAAHLG
jgi:pyruvate, orthophosphate dikinase